MSGLGNTPPPGDRPGSHSLIYFLTLHKAENDKIMRHLPKGSFPDGLIRAKRLFYAIFLSLHRAEKNRYAEN